MQPRERRKDSLKSAVPQVQHGQHHRVHCIQVVPDVTASRQERPPPWLWQNFHSGNEKEKLSLSSIKNPSGCWLGHFAQWLEHLPSTHKVLGLILSTSKLFFMFLLFYSNYIFFE